MQTRPAAVIDANVLVQAPVRDTLLRLAEGPELYRPLWSAEIMAEVRRTLNRQFGISPNRIANLESKLREHFPEPQALPVGVDAALAGHRSRSQSVPEKVVCYRSQFRCRGSSATGRGNQPNVRRSVTRIAQGRPGLCRSCLSRHSNQTVRAAGLVYERVLPRTHFH